MQPAERLAPPPESTKAAPLLANITQNYAACRRDIDKLDLLQAWVQEQARVKP